MLSELIRSRPGRQGITISRLIVAFIIVASAPVALRPAAAAGDAQSGRQIAQRWCSSCHVVSPEQPIGSPDVPSFLAIGRSEDLTESILTAFLSRSHPPMPDMSLSRGEISDLVAYLRSLR